jgi:hypothetical protein
MSVWFHSHIPEFPFFFLAESHACLDDAVDDRSDYVSNTKVMSGDQAISLDLCCAQAEFRESSIMRVICVNVNPIER